VKIVFLGTPEFAVPCAAALLEAGHDLRAVVTQPDRPSGRGHRVQMPPMKRFALERRIPVIQPSTLRDPAVLDRLRSFEPDLLVVAAYGKILPPPMLSLAPRGAINVHASLLPKYRGAAPIERCLLAGDPVTGVTILQMNERMDAGDILLQREEAVRSDDTAASLRERLARLGAETLVEALGQLERGELRPRPQRDEEATYAPMLRKEEGRIDWTKSAVEIERAVRAFQPWPTAWTGLRGRRLAVFRARPTASGEGPPGTVLEVGDDAIRVATGAGTLELLEVQLEGRRRMPARQFAVGRLVAPGERLG
jgi:methionyl-tRNA formyltransferase